MSVQPIPWTAMREYAEVSGVGDVEQFCTLIRALDVEWLGSIRKRKD